MTDIKLYLRLFNLESSRFGEQFGRLGAFERAQELKKQRNAFVSEVFKSELGLSGDEELSKNRFGKPFFSSKRNIHFSISHTDFMIGLAVSNRQIGLDIERVRAVSDRLIERCLSGKERELILSAEEAERDRIFTELWTMKEAYIKWRGRSIFTDIAEISVLDRSFLTSSLPDSHMLSIYSKNTGEGDTLCVKFI